MIDHLLQPLACERFLTDARYREGHLRVVNALPERRILGLHSPEIKAVAKQLSREGGEVVMTDETHRMRTNGAEVIRAFEAVPSECLLLFATSFSLFFRKVISLPYSFSGFFLGRPLLVSFLSIVCLFSIL